MGGGGFSRSSKPPPHGKSPRGRGPPPDDAGQRPRGEVGSGTKRPLTDIATHPEALPPYGRDISGCYLSIFLCLADEYQVRMQARTALVEAAGVHWDTIEPNRGDILLMVATIRHHGMPALPGAREGLQGALFHFWTPDAKNLHHEPNHTHLDPTSPPLESLAVAGDLSS